MTNSKNFVIIFLEKEKKKLLTFLELFVIIITENKKGDFGKNERFLYWRNWYDGNFPNFRNWRNGRNVFLEKCIDFPKII